MYGANVKNVCCVHSYVIKFLCHFFESFFHSWVTFFTHLFVCNECTKFTACPLPVNWLSQLAQLCKHIINQSGLYFEAGFLLHVTARSD